MNAIPFLLTSALFFFTLAIVGYAGMKKVKTYESIWGAMYIYGLILWVCCTLGAMLKFLIS